MSDQNTYNEEQINLLTRLQTLDNTLDTLEDSKGNLPKLVAQSAENVAALEEKLLLLEKRLQQYKQAIETKEESAKEVKKEIAALEKKKKEAKNDQQYALISRDLELKQLDILLVRKKIKEYKHIVAQEAGQLKELKQALNEETKILKGKQKSLTAISKESDVTKRKVSQERKGVIEDIDIKFRNIYEDLRAYASNNAVVNVVNNACNGCYIAVPEQTQLEIKNRDKIVTCEECCRILAYVEAVPEKEKPKKRSHTTKRAKAA